MKMKDRLQIVLAVVLLAVLVVGMPYLYSKQNDDTTHEVAENVVETVQEEVVPEPMSQAVRIVKTAEMPLQNVGQRITNKKYVAGLLAKTVNETTFSVSVKTDMPIEKVLAQIVNPETNEVVYEGPLGVSYGTSGDSDTYQISFNRYVFKDNTMWDGVVPNERYVEYPVRLVLQSGYDSSVLIY